MFFSYYIAPIMNIIQEPLRLDTWTDVAFMALVFMMPLYVYQRVSGRKIPWGYYVLFGIIGQFSLAVVNFYLALALCILIMYLVAFHRAVRWSELATGLIMSFVTARLFITVFSLIFRMGIAEPLHLNQRLGSDTYVIVIDIYYCAAFLLLLPWVTKKIAPTMRRYFDIVVPTHPALAWLGNIVLLTYTIIRYGQNYRTFLIPWGLYCLVYLAYVLFYWFFMKITTNYTLMRIEVENQKVELNNLRIYTSHIEALYDDLRRFRHDYKNVLYSLTGALSNRNVDQAQDILNRVVKPTEETVSMRTAVLGRLANIEDLDVKSLVYSKVMDALNRDIDVQVEVEKPFKFGKTMEQLDIVRIIAILMDNAINGAEKAAKKAVNLSLFEKDNLQYLVVGNTTKEEYLDLRELAKNATEINLGSNHGLGLKNLRMILSRYPNVTWEQSSEDYWFNQTIIIPK